MLSLSLLFIDNILFNMPWYFYSIIAMLSFSAMVLLIKRIRDLGFSSRKINLFLFGFVFLDFILINVPSLDKTIASPNFWYSLELIFLTSIVAIFANLANIKSIGIAPNPGYSQAIKDTNILPVTILSVLIFGSEFSLLKIFGAVLILGGIFLLIKKEFSVNLKQRRRNFPWYIYSLGAALFFTAGALLLKKITLLGLSSKEINLFLFGLSWIGFLILNIQMLRGITRDKKFSQFLKLAFLASCFSFSGNLFGLQAITLAPNPGYYEAIKSASVLIVTFLSTKFFSSDATPSRIFGTIVIILGVTLLVL